ncbi:hypothetical protein LUZ61_000584 [Rhynchospora tenuis]|uniref:Protein kinase domain-containing protein n=1 Tax=Rhynchospora tenuis TaxID=198213 RepID=A0AAD6EPY3_9POAL|nr:hypothetical protein LUZ61_000584 [Rhynchospora tenuis]
MQETKINTAVALLHLLLLLSPSKTKGTESAKISLPNCLDNCGGIPIPYPFGVSPNCSLSDAFLVSCNATNSGNSTFTPYWSFGSQALEISLSLGRLQVLDISLSLGELRVTTPISSYCYNTTSKENDDLYLYWDLSNSSFGFNYEKNKFVVIGCNTLAYIQYSPNNRNYYWGACGSWCDGLDTLTNGSTCTGIGCSQTVIPNGTNYFYVYFEESYNNSEIYNFSRCGYAMVMEPDNFTFNTNYITTDALEHENLPIVIDWVIDKTNCTIAQANKSSYACISENSECVDSSSGLGYLCNCYGGYQGNPYLKGGCQDVNECVSQNPCSQPGKCYNIQGGYRCSCPFGWRRQKQTDVCELNLALILEALAYLHSSASPPIFHGDVKSTNILLDKSYMAKVSDFGASILAPTDEAQMVTLVQGTCGYLDPEYLQSCKLTDKSDVYSFGVVILELLTSKPVIDFGVPEKEKGLSSRFLAAMEETKIDELLDDEIKCEDDMEVIMKVAELAKECLNMKGAERPTMKEVAEELDRICKIKQHPWGEEYHPEEFETLLSGASHIMEIEQTSSFSLRKQADKSIAVGR